MNILLLGLSHCNASPRHTIPSVESQEIWFVSIADQNDKYSPAPTISIFWAKNCP